MNYRSLSAIVFAIIVAVEIYFFLQVPTPTVMQTTGTGKWVGTKQVIDYRAQSNNTVKYGVIIGATILIGGIFTFSIPNKK